MSFFTKATAAKSLFLLGLLCPALTGNAQQATVDKSVLSIERNAIDGTPSLIQFSADANWKTGQEQQIFSKYLGVDGVNTQMIRMYRTTTKVGVTTSRYAEYYKGVKVAYGSFTLTEKGGRIHFISGNHYNTPANASATPAITEGVALGKALNQVGATRYMWQDPSAEANLKETYHKPDTSYYPKGQLVWIENFKADKPDRQLHLAYGFNIYAQAPVTRQMVYIDATDGTVLYTENLIKHTAASNKTLYSGVVPFVTSRITGPTYTLYDSTRGGGIYTRSVNHNTSVTGVTQINSATNNWPAATTDTGAIDVHWGVEKVYDYWFTQQGRNSWDGAGGILLSYVHMNDAGGNMDNAYWDGSEMCYGDGTGCTGAGAAGFFLGPLTSLDVTGHELGHGICQATANLVYASESGAMNEGLSDCWGATIEHWADPHETDGQAKLYFKIGEEIGCGYAPLRSMDFPHNESNPDTYGTNDPFWVNVTGCTPSGGNDQCGVHTNSGVTNKWYYLVISGGTGTNANGTSYSVNAIGWTDAANILYQTELALSSSANYASFRSTSIAQATLLFGACSPQVQSVTNAWYAVGVGTAFVPCTPQIGFTTTTYNVTEKSTATTCPASHTVSIGVKATGTPITGGNPIVTVSAAYGTAVAGTDYTLSGSPITFAAGDTTTHYVTMTVFDNGALNDSKNLVLAMTLNAMGSTATVAPGYDTARITISNDDSGIVNGFAEYHTLNSGTAVTCNTTSALLGNYRKARSQFLLLASEMATAGVRPGVPITQIAFNILTRNYTGAYNGYTISMGNTTAADLSTAFVTTGLTQVYTGNHTTPTIAGTDSIDFVTPFTWDGTSNVVVNICFSGNTGTLGTASDQLSGIDHGSLIVCDHNQSTSGTGTAGCSLNYSGGGQGTARPVMRFKQTPPASKIATVLGNNHTWSVTSGTTVNFWNTSDTSLVATVANPTANLGCTSATLTGAGTGFTPAAFTTGTNRSRKEVTLTPTTNGATVTYDATMYLTTTELAGATPSTLFMVKTEEPTDATINAANSTLLTPTLVTGSNFTGFKGTFTVMNNTRIFITDGPLCTAPATTVTASGPTTFCSGGSVTLSAPVATGVTYQWQSGTTNIPGATSSSYTTGAAGTYRVIVSQGSCAGTSTATTVTVNTVNAGTITTTGGTSMCAGQSLVYTDAAGSGTWSSNNTAVATVDAAGNVYGVSGGTTTISYTVSNICGTASATQAVTVNANPTVAATTGTGVVCEGATTALNNTTPLGTWSSANPATATVDASGNVGGGTTGTTTISYSVTNVAGCTTFVTTPVTVNATPATTITPSGATTFCPTGSVTLSAPTGTGLSYQWYSNGSIITGATNSSYSTNLGADYTVLVSTGNCSATSATTTVTIDLSATVIPAVSIAATPGLVLCSVPTTITFGATPTNGGTTPTYTWYVNGTSMGTGNSFSYVPATGDQVQCVLNSNAICRLHDTGSSTVTVNIAPPSHPTVAINAIPNDTLCAGVMATFAAIPSFGGSAPSYIWNKNGVNVATGPAYNYIPANGDILKVIMTSNYSCRSQDTAVGGPMTLTVLTSLPNTVTVTSDHATIPHTGSVTFTATAPNGGSSPTYQWYVNGTPVSGATNATYTSSTLGEGDVVTCGVLSSEMCASPSYAYSAGMVMHWTAGVTNITAGNQLILVPNPNNGTFTIKGTLVTNDETITIQVTNMLGQEVFLTNALVNNNTIDRTISLQQSLASGAYLVNVTTGTGKQVFHMVVNK